LGTRVDPAVLRRFKRATETTAVTATPPARFMSSTKWPKCKAVFENIQNQGNCAASWAMATTGSIADRMCIRLVLKNCNFLMSNYAVDTMPQNQKSQLGTFCPVVKFACNSEAMGINFRVLNVCLYN
jgi:hypothetical protein